MSKTNALIIAAEFNKPLIDAMIEHAVDELKGLEVQLTQVVRVPGCYEVPLVAGAAFGLPVSFLVVLGYIERGETLHGEVMGHVTHQALLQLSLSHAKPVGIGIIGPGATPEQAEARKEGYARAAVRAAFASVRALEALKKAG
jgi:6,7-dimethyl-8-ribityllumazine synthase